MSAKRTVFCWSRIWEFQSIPLVQPNFKVLDSIKPAPGRITLKDTNIAPDNAPDGMEFWRPGSPLPFADQFSDVRLDRAVREDDVLPDILPVQGQTMVSEAMRDAMMACDPEGGHEFLPTLFYDVNGRKVGAQDYFRWWPGRIANVTKSGSRDYPMSTDWSIRHLAEGLFGNHAQALCLSHLPFWTDITLKGVYFSQEVFAALKAFTLTGLEEFTKKGGRYAQAPDGHLLHPLEFVSHVHVPLAVDP